MSIRRLYLPLTDHKGIYFEGGVAFAVSAFRQADASGGSISDGGLRAPMPGKIVAAPAKVGDVVTKGQPVVVLEAMKMEHALTAPFDGVVESFDRRRRPGRGGRGPGGGEGLDLETDAADGAGIGRFPNTAIRLRAGRSSAVSWIWADHTVWVALLVQTSVTQRASGSIGVMGHHIGVAAGSFHAGIEQTAGQVVATTGMRRQSRNQAVHADPWALGTGARTAVSNGPKI